MVRWPLLAITILAAGAPALRAQPNLSIASLIVQLVEDGPAAPAAHEFFPGETVYGTFRIAGYRKQEANDREFISLSHRMEATDAAGVPIVPPVAGKVAAELASQDKNWLPKVNFAFEVPPLAGSGSYRVEIVVKDENSGQSATREVRFSVRGTEVQPSDALAVRNFRFFRKEDDMQALTVPAYRPGDALWARFDMVGYKFGAKNRYELAYGLEVLRATGESVFREPEAANLQEETFYPKRYIPGALNLNLSADTERGTYTILLRVKDLLGKQESEGRYTFTVE